MLPHRYQETQYLAALNDRFANYISNVHHVQEQTKSIENATLVSHIKSLSDEMSSLKEMYDAEITKLRSALDDSMKERNAKELSANKHIVLSAELEKKCNEEAAEKKKLQVALGESHRIITERDAAIAILHTNISEHKKENADLKKAKDAVDAFAAQLQTMHDNEATKRTDLETQLATARDKANFDREKYTKNIAELESRIRAADMAIKIAEDRLKEHDAIDEQLAGTLAKVKQQSHAEFLRFQEEAEYGYLASLQSVKNQLEETAKSLSSALQDNIQLKAQLDDQKAAAVKESNKSVAVENENKSLIKQAEIERQNFAIACANQEALIRRLKEDINTKIRELSAAYNSNIPVDIEIEAFNGLLDAEEKRLRLSLTNPAPQIISSTNIKRPVTSVTRPLTSRKQEPIGVAAPAIAPRVTCSYEDVSPLYCTGVPLYRNSAYARSRRIASLQARLSGN